MRLLFIVVLLLKLIPAKAQYEYLLHKTYAERHTLLREMNFEIIEVVNGKKPDQVFARMRVIEEMARKAGDEELLLETEVLHAWLALQLDTANKGHSIHEKNCYSCWNRHRI